MASFLVSDNRTEHSLTSSVISPSLEHITQSRQQPFRFLELPLELQRAVFEAYFKDASPTVRTRKSGADSPKEGDGRSVNLTLVQMPSLAIEQTSTYFRELSLAARKKMVSKTLTICSGASLVLGAEAESKWRGYHWLHEHIERIEIKFLCNIDEIRRSQRLAGPEDFGRHLGCIFAMFVRLRIIFLHPNLGCRLDVPDKTAVIALLKSGRFDVDEIDAILNRDTVKLRLALHTWGKQWLWAAGQRLTLKLTLKTQFRHWNEAEDIEDLVVWSRKHIEFEIGADSAEIRDLERTWGIPVRTNMAVSSIEDVAAKLDAVKQKEKKLVGESSEDQL